jgi:hypothetical protein
MLHVDDAGFVRAPAPLVYRRLTDVGRWPTWWRGVRTTPMGDGTGREVWALELSRDRLRGLRVAAWPHGYRHETGFRLALTGDLEGESEFWLEPVDGGTVVHHLCAASATRAPARTLATYRVVARRGLWGLKDALQTEVRTAIGLAP